MKRLLIVCMILVTALSGCTKHRAYRIEHVSQAVETSIEELAQSTDAELVRIQGFSVESHAEFDLGVVEFDDQGEFWDGDQVLAIERTIGGATRDTDYGGVLIVAFVHGWKHNARVCDENVVCFREVLRSLNNFEIDSSRTLEQPPRRVIGVYVGWRGLSTKGPLLKQSSFWSRKATAHRIGRGPLLELFIRLEAARDRQQALGGSNSKLAIVAHSFGAAAVYSAVSHSLQERLSDVAFSNDEKTDDAEPHLIEGLGDLLVLVNPAFEAQLYTPIQDLSSTQPGFYRRQPAILLVMTSRSDTATKNLFPLGRFFSTMFAKTRSSDQKAAMRTAIGHYTEYQTHDLEEVALPKQDTDLDDLSEPTKSERTGAGICKCRYLEAKTPDELDLFNKPVMSKKDFPYSEANEGVFGKALLSRNLDVDPLNPYLVVLTSDGIVKKHNGIFGKLFVGFLRDFSLAMDARAHLP